MKRIILSFIVALAGIFGLTGHGTALAATNSANDLCQIGNLSAVLSASWSYNSGVISSPYDAEEALNSPPAGWRVQSKSQGYAWSNQSHTAIVFTGYVIYQYQDGSTQPIHNRIAVANGTSVTRYCSYV